MPGEATRAIISIDRTGVYRSEDEACPMVSQRDVRGAWSADVGMPHVEVSHGESGSTIFAVCTWLVGSDELTICGQWSPELREQGVALIRSMIIDPVDDLGMFAGFTPDGALLVIATDALGLRLSSNVLPGDGLVTLARDVVTT